jgi:hypothetical protein
LVIIARIFWYLFRKLKKLMVYKISKSPKPNTAGQCFKGFVGFIAYAA